MFPAITKKSLSLTRIRVSSSTRQLLLCRRRMALPPSGRRCSRAPRLLTRRSRSKSLSDTSKAKQGARRCG